MSSNLFLGIDTSNYTTSLGLVDGDGNVVANIKKLLPVKSGECGLRQSDALFHHTVQLPELWEKMSEVLNGRSITAVAVSEKPRNAEGSYMPCFLVGVANAVSVSSALSVPLYRVSHQCGHLMAAIYDSGRKELFSRPFGAFHVSGGTTELLHATFNGRAFIAEKIGGTADLNAGQAIDRIGVMLGLDFPCGPALEKLALTNTEKIPKPKVSTDGLYVHLSGLQNLAEKLYRETGSKPLVAAYTLAFVAESLSAMSKAYLAAFGSSTLLYAGGVMSNAYIKSYLAERYDAAFAKPALSADNAVGVALLCRRLYPGTEDF